jgi:hypothetical protein
VRFIQRNAWLVARVSTSVVWLVAWSALTVTGAIPKDFASALPLVTMAVPTILLVIAEFNHAQGRPDISIGDAKPVEPYNIYSDTGTIAIVRGLRIPISNSGAPVEVTPRLEISPDPAANPRVRVLHREQDWLIAGGKVFAERTMLARGESRWFEVFSIADSGGGPGVVVHNALQYGSVEWLDLRGQYEITITAFGGNEAPRAKRFDLSVDPSIGELRLDPR